MPRGEVRYRMVLDSNVKEKAEESANAMGKAETATGQWTDAMQRSAMQMSALQDEALKMNAALAQSAEQVQEWGTQQQRAAMRMESMHEEALKMNASFKPLNDDTQRTADTMRAFAAALPIEQTQALTSVTDLAGVGFKNLMNTQAGFNAQSAGVVGAGLAIGTAIGSWLNTFPEVQHAADAVRDSLIEMVGQGLIETAAQKEKAALEGMAEFTAQMAKSNDEAVARQIAGLKAQGLSLEAIDALYRKHEPAARTAIDRLHEEAEAHKAAEKAAKEHAAKATEEFQKYLQSVKETTKATEAARAADDKFVADMQAKGRAALWAMADENTKAAKKMAEVDRARFDEHIKGVEEMHKVEKKFFEDLEEAYEKNLEVQHKAQEQALKDLDDVGAILDDIDGLMRQLGVTSDSTWGRMIKGLEAVQQGGKAFAQFASGDIMGGISSGIGAISGLMGALGIGGNKEHMQVNDKRDAFVELHGGIAKLNAEAAAAGKTLDAMLKAKTVKDYEAAIKDLTGALDLHDQAVEETTAAMERWQVGYSKVDAEAANLMKDQQLLVAKGFDLNMVNEKMAEGWSQYVQDVLESGESIPESLRGTIDHLQEMGLLVDENGDAFDDATVQGLNFTDKLTDQMSKLIDEIHRMVNALLGINDVDLDVGVRTHPTGGGRTSGGDEDYQRDTGHASGTQGFQDFGSGTRTTLHGTEGVFRPNDLQGVARMMSDMMGDGGGSGGGGDIYLDGARVGRQLAKRMESGYVRPKQSQRGTM